MRRHLTAVVVLAGDTALTAASQGYRPLWALALYALVVAAILALQYRSPAAAFIVVLVLAVLTGGAYVLLLWAAYQAGNAALSRFGTAIVIGTTLGGVGLFLAKVPANGLAMARAGTAYTILVVLPLLVGRYLAQNRRLVAALRQQTEQHSEQERLRERLRIARDMHDSLGHRLSLVSVQAAALEVTTLPAEQRLAVRQLAIATRDAVDELHELVGALRGPEDSVGPALGAVDALVEERRNCGMTVELRRNGAPRRLPEPGGQAAYRVVEEGLTNAAKHAPGQPVTVSMAWEADALLVTVHNPVAAAGSGAGHGLAGLAERVGAAGGFLDHRSLDGVFRLVAMLPLTAADAGRVGPARSVAVGVAAAVLMFGLLPMTMLFGVAR
jgi:signal transduction histidine kinase